MAGFPGFVQPLAATYDQFMDYCVERRFFRGMRELSVVIRGALMGARYSGCSFLSRMGTFGWSAFGWAGLVATILEIIPLGRIRFRR